MNKYKINRNFELEKYGQEIPIDQELRDLLRQIFNKHNVIDLYEDNETNFDEYDTEIDLVILRLDREMPYKKFLKLIYDIFEDMCGKGAGGSMKNYEGLAEETYKILKVNNLIK